MALKDLKQKLAQNGGASPAPAVRPKVLIVDDDESVLRALRVVLRADYDVEVCSDSGIAPHLCKQMRPDVVVLDVLMPGMDGFEVFAAIRAFNADVPIILNSAYQSLRPIPDVIANLRPFQYLSKSGNINEFRVVLANALASRRVV